MKKLAPKETVTWRQKVQLAKLHAPGYGSMPLTLRVGYEVLLSGCWEFTGFLDKDGYGLINDFRRGYHGSCQAHRYLYEIWVMETIPRHLEMDHRCFNRACVNPEHLDVTTSERNKRRRKPKLGLAA